MTAESIFRARLARIEERFHGARCRTALKQLREKSEDDLDRLLRHHLPNAITHIETVRRERVDMLLGFYSILEIALIAGYLRETDVAAHVASARGVLQRPPLVRYYTRHYPLSLVRRFAARVEGRPDTRPAPPSGQGAAAGLVEEFLWLADQVGRSEEIQTFYWFLDDGYSEDEGLPDLQKSLASPDKVFGAFSTAASRRGPTQDAIVGFSEFLGVCERLKALIDAAAMVPELQVAFWSYFEYWFVALKDKMRRSLEAAISAVRGGPAMRAELAPGTDPAAAALGTATQAQARKTVELLESLTSGAFRG